MALGTYTDIEAAVIVWLNRVGASDIAANTPDFIELSQRRLQREVRVPPMETLVEGLTITAGSASIPTDMLDVKEVIAYDGQSAWDVFRSTYTKVKAARLSGLCGPTNFDTVAGNFMFGPEPSAGVSVDLVYYKEIEFISALVSQNWFSQYAPETILYGALVEASVFMKDTEQEQKYEQKFKEAVQSLKDQKQKAEHAGRLQIQTK